MPFGVVHERPCLRATIRVIPANNRRHAKHVEDEALVCNFQGRSITENAWSPIIETRGGVDTKVLRGDAVQLGENQTITMSECVDALLLQAVGHKV